MPLPFAPDDADQVLADFGQDLICAAVPAVTRGLIDTGVVEESFGETTVGKAVYVLRVKRGAFGDTKVKSTRVDIGSPAESFTIDNPIPHPSSLFDHYALQPLRTKAST
jgi:hypothetical protein